MDGGYHRGYSDASNGINNNPYRYASGAYWDYLDGQQDYYLTHSKKMLYSWHSKDTGAIQNGQAD